MIHVRKALKTLIWMFLLAISSSLLIASALIQPKFNAFLAGPFVIGLLALGVLIGLFFYTLFLAVSTKEPMFVYFSLIMALLTILQTFSSYDRFVFFLTYNRVTLITHLLFVTFLLFFETFFSLKEHAPRLSRCNRISLVVIVVFTALFLFSKAVFPHAASYHAVLDFTRELFVFYTNILFLSTIILSIRWMKTEAILLLIAFIPPAFITSINALNIFPFMQSHEKFVTFLFQYNQPIGLSLQAVLFSLATANRYNRLKLERQKAENDREQLQKITNEKTRFFMNMSHETRTPLTIILGMTRQLRQGSYGSSLKQADHILAAIERNSFILLRQVNHMLRLEKSRQNDGIHLVDVQALLFLIVQEFTPLAQEKHLELSLEKPEDVHPVALCVSRDDFESLIMNLLSNAFKYTYEGGRIRISYHQGPQGALRISVSDNGKGIPKEQQKRVFEQYETIQDVSSNMQVGLGLPLVKHIMEGYMGCVQLDSEEGKGSTFSLVFPSNLVQAKKDMIQSESDGVTLLGQLYLAEFSSLPDKDIEGVEHTKRILVLEDNADLRAYIQSILQSNYQVVTSDSGSDGLKKLSQSHFDVIISDVMMPGMDGYGFLKEAKKILKEAPVPLIFLTARDSLEEKIDALKAGAIRYITKPFQPELLLAVIDSILIHDRELVDSHVQLLRQGLESLLDKIEHPQVRMKEKDSSVQLSLYDLSAREKEVISLMMKGKSDKEIAFTLHVSVRTIANHNRNIYRKCKVSGRYELLSKLMVS